MAGKPAAVPAPQAKDALQTLPLPELETQLGTSPEGLSSEEAARRLSQYGPNEIPEKTISPLR